MRRIRYSVAMSLDGYIAGPNGEFDWIDMDPSDGAEYFKAFYAQFDTAIMGPHYVGCQRVAPAVLNEQNGSDNGHRTRQMYDPRVRAKSTLSSRSTLRF